MLAGMHARRLQLEQELREGVRPVITWAVRERSDEPQELTCPLGMSRQKNSSRFDHGRDNFHPAELIEAVVGLDRADVTDIALSQETPKAFTGPDRLDHEQVGLPGLIELLDPAKKVRVVVLNLLAVNETDIIADDVADQGRTKVATILGECRVDTDNAVVVLRKLRVGPEPSRVDRAAAGLDGSLHVLRLEVHFPLRGPQFLENDIRKPFRLQQFALPELVDFIIVEMKSHVGRRYSRDVEMHRILPEPQQERREVVNMEPLHDDNENAVGWIAPAVGDRACIKLFEVPSFRFGMREACLLWIVNHDDIKTVPGNATLHGESSDLATGRRFKKRFGVFLLPDARSPGQGSVPLAAQDLADLAQLRRGERFVVTNDGDPERRVMHQQPCDVRYANQVRFQRLGWLIDDQPPVLATKATLQFVSDRLLMPIHEELSAGLQGRHGPQGKIKKRAPIDGREGLHVIHRSILCTV